ncbi:fimbrial protein [Salmonella enterica subsp. diarizonae]|nr:fimbrial protein [Salmonella enterica subsp. diarizonae]
MIKSGSGTMKTRDDRSSFAQSCRLNLLSLCLSMLCILVLPGYAHATDLDSEALGCIRTDGNDGSIQLDLPSSVSFSPENAPAIGKVIYRSKNYSIHYKCKARGGGTIQLQRLGDVASLGTALAAAGLALKFEVKNSFTTGSASSSTVTYSPLPPETDQVAVSSYYTDTQEGTLTVQFILSVSQTPRATFVAVPGLTAFKLTAQNGGGGYPGISISTTPFRLQYVPTCFVKTSLGTNNVDFGPVITSDINNDFTQTRPFTVMASVNNDSDCDSVNLQKPYNAEKQSFYLYLPLKVTFSVVSGGTPSSDNGSIILKNENGEDNGLQLKISDPAGNYVTFGDVLQPDSHPANQLGEFDNGIFTVNKQYTATLSSTGGQVKTGKYNAQVTVKVSYY